MREYKDAFGHKHDLDNPETNDHYPQNIEELEHKVMRDYGWSCAHIPRQATGTLKMDNLYYN